MRLIDAETRKLKYFESSDVVKYAVLSHRWEEEEITLQDLISNEAESKKGYAKFISSCDETLRAGLSYVWIDTCCIDKSSSAELSEAINSMYKWYQNAEVCFAYLSDVEQLSGLGNSLWFTRGWTLQELVAPKNLRFYDKYWRCFGSKIGLQARISDLTGIPIRILRGDDKPSVRSVAQRMSWAAGRITTRLEDQAYCLMGLFDINMPLLYGEGSKAFLRLQEEIIKASDDHSIFAWTSNDSGRRGILAPSPSCFKNSASTISTAESSVPEQYSVTNVGLSIRLPVLPWTTNVYMAVLQCNNKDTLLEKELMPLARRKSQNLRLGILLRKTGRAKQFVRIALDGCDIHTIDISEQKRWLRVVDLLILLRPEPIVDPKHLYGFVFRNISSTMSNFSPVSQNTPIAGTWSSRRYHDLRTWFMTPGTNEPGFRPLSDEQQVIAYDLEVGEQGIVVSFQQQNSGIARAIAFGFDFDFNPVCLIYKTGSPERRGPSHDNNTAFADCEEIEDQLKIYQDMPIAQSWDDYEICALRSSQSIGLQAHLEMLNMHIDISEGWRDDDEKAWVVDINAIDLPHIRPDELNVESKDHGVAVPLKMKSSPVKPGTNLGTSIPKSGVRLKPEENDFEKVAKLHGWKQDIRRYETLEKSLEWFRNEVSDCLKEEERLKRTRYEEKKWLKSEERLVRFRELALSHIKLQRNEYMTAGDSRLLHELEVQWLQEREALDRLHREVSRRKQEDGELRRLHEMSQDRQGYKK